MRNMVVMVPLSAYEKKVWQTDIQKFTKFKYVDLEKLVSLYNESPKALDKYLDYYDVIICKHTHIKQDQCANLLKLIFANPLTLLCVDEVHAFRNPGSDLSTIMKNLTRPCKTFWGITGTYISIGAENLYHIINLIYPWYLGSFRQYQNDYLDTQKRRVYTGYKKFKEVTDVIGFKNPDALREKLAPVLITGSSFFNVHYHYLDYDLTDYEQKIYTKLANGINFAKDADNDSWFRDVLAQDFQDPPRIKNVEQFGSRFFALQYAADGIIAPNGDLTNVDGTKVRMLHDLLSTITAKGQSALVFFDYYAPLKVCHQVLNDLPNVVILESTGESVLSEKDVSDVKCKAHPHIILCTRASSESVSYPYINNVIFFECPVIPSTLVQGLGRITRKNSLYPDDLNCYLFRSTNIDLYKLLVVSSRVRLQELSSGEVEGNCPPDYKSVLSKEHTQEQARRLLLWQK